MYIHIRKRRHELTLHQESDKQNTFVVPENIDLEICSPQPDQEQNTLLAQN